MGRWGGWGSGSFAGWRLLRLEGGMLLALGLWRQVDKARGPGKGLGAKSGVVA